MSAITPMVLSGSARPLSTAAIGIVTWSPILTSDITIFFLSQLTVAVDQVLSFFEVEYFRVEKRYQKDQVRFQQSVLDL